MRPAMAAAGTRSGASRCASSASSSALSGAASSPACAWAVSSTARRRSADRLVDQAVAAGDGERVERALPVAGAALQVEQRLDRPGELRVERQRALGELARGLRLALALRFQEQAAQAELLGVGRGQHGLEDAARGGAVAGELGGLRAQQVRERLVGQRLARLAGVADGQRAVAGADGDDAARQRIEAALLPPPVQDAADVGRARPRCGAAATRPAASAPISAARMTKARNTLVSAM